MNDLLDELEKRYRRVESEKSDYAFFNKLSQYVKYVLKLPELQSEIKQISKEKKEMEVPEMYELSEKTEQQLNAEENFERKHKETDWWAWEHLRAVPDVVSKETPEAYLKKNDSAYCFYNTRNLFCNTDGYEHGFAVRVDYEKLSKEDYKKGIEDFREYYAPNIHERFKNCLIDKLRGFSKKTKSNVKRSFNLTTSHWQDITLKFVNKYDVEIFLNGTYFQKINNVDLGCYQGKDEEEDKQWTFLRNLSLQKGEYDYGRLLQKKREPIRQQKGKLAERLKYLFGIKDDPFDTISFTYKTKFKIEPEPTIRGGGETWGSQEKNFYQEETNEQSNMKMKKYLPDC